MARPKLSEHDRTRYQELAAAALVPHPHRLEFRGSPEKMVWPALCANCGNPSSERIPVSKAFFRRSHRSNRGLGPFNYRIYTVALPFCATCAARHRETLPHISPFARWRSFILNPAHIATIGFAVLLLKIGPDTFDVADTSSGSFVGLGLLGILMFGMLWTIGVVWWATRPDRLEPRTDITKACDFSEDVAMPFEGGRHLYAVQNQAFATALTDANRDRVWTAADQRRMLSHSAIVSALFLGVLIAARVLMWFFTGK